MIVVSDTSPLNYLILIDCIGILPQLFEEVAVPRAVLHELKHSGAPEIVCVFAADPPAWLKVFDDPPQETALMSDLDPGETSAILLAYELGAERLLIDDAAARAYAEVQGITVTGTLGVLLMAADARMIDLDEAFAKLAITTFRASASLLAQLMAEHKANLRRQR